MEGETGAYDSYLRVILDNIPVGIVFVDGNGRCTSSNRKFGEITGYGTNLIKKNFSDMIHSGDTETVRNKMSEAIDGKNQSTCTVRLMRKDGGMVWLEMDVCAVDCDDEKELLVNVVDITERKEMENNLEISNKKMEEIIARERRFMEDISHYFFNPLCIAKGYIDLSIREADPNMARKLEITRTAVNRVENIVKHIVTERRIYE